MFYGQIVDNPVDNLLQRLGFGSPTGFADGRQRLPSPVLRT